MLTYLALTIAALPAQDPESILRTMRERQVARWDSVENYAVVQSVQGLETAVYFVKDTIEGQVTVRSIPPALWRGTAEERQQSRELFGHAAAGFDLMATAQEQEVGGPMAAVVRSMTDDMGRFASALASTPEPTDGRPEAAESIRAMAEFTRRARLEGRVELGGRQAFHLRADDPSGLGGRQAAGPASFSVRSVEFWIDATEYVPLRLLMEGTMEADGKKAPITIDLLQQDYAPVGSLYQPRRLVMRLSGLIEAMATDPKKQKEMAKTRQEMARMREQMAKMKDQLAKMPAGQRRMIEGRMKQAMAQAEQMMGDGIFETVVEQTVYSVNQGPPVDWKPGLPN